MPMYDTTEVEKLKHRLSIAELPETEARLDAGLYELLYDLYEKIPSLQAASFWSTPKIRIPSYPNAVRISLTLEQSFEDALEHANDTTSVSIDKIETNYKKEYTRHGVIVELIITVEAEMDEAYLQCLRDIGKVHVSVNNYTSESVHCETGNSIPF